VFDGTKFILYAASTYTSPDGSVWTKVGGNLGLTGVVYQEGRFFGTGGGKLLFSQDGMTWTGVHDLSAMETADVAGNGPRLAVGSILK